MAKRNSGERNERLHEENRKLKQQIENLKKEIRRLKSVNKTLDTAWKKTEIYLSEVTDGRSVEEIVRNVAKGKKLSKLENSCSKCGSPKVNVLKYKNFRLVVCDERNCKYREKIDGAKAEQE